MATTGRTIIKATKRITSPDGVVTDAPPQYWLRAEGDACTGDVTAFQTASAGLNFDTQLTISMPQAASGTHWVISSCGPTLGLTVLIDSSDFVPDQTGPDGSDLSTLDISSESNVQYFNP
ncbi:MAG: hypothetical protein J0I82_01910 [Spirosoma sp.]|nr:hypothetical protein [Spirosoma sp. 48-14]MBN8820754.1 hypothetical protein [Spirosoma sp.]